MKAAIILTRDQVQSLLDFCSRHRRAQYFIAKDHGAYLGQSLGMEPAPRCLFYFPGCNPEIDADYYATARHQFGGDDFGDLMDVTDLERIMQETPSATAIKWTVTDTQILISTFE